MATHSSVLSWRMPLERGAWRATIHRVAKSQINWATWHLCKMFPWHLQFSWRNLQSFSFCCFILVLYTVHWRRPFCLSVLFFGNLYLVGYTFPFLPCFSLLSLAMCKASSYTHFAFLLFFFFGMEWSNWTYKPKKKKVIKLKRWSIFWFIWVQY